MGSQVLQSGKRSFSWCWGASKFINTEETCLPAFASRHCYFNRSASESLTPRSLRNYTDVVTLEADLRWVWNAEKAVLNLQKHHVSFELAERALSDPLSISIPDTHPLEERWRTLCMPAIGPAVVLFIVHTWPDDEGCGRIISARRAEPHERKAYEEG